MSSLTFTVGFPGYCGILQHVSCTALQNIRRNALSLPDVYKPRIAGWLTRVEIVMGLFKPSKALTSIGSNAESILASTVAEGNTFSWVCWTVDESRLTGAGVGLCTASVDAGRITVRDTTIVLEYETFRALALIRSNTGSTATICYL